MGFNLCIMIYLHKDDNKKVPTQAREN